jgi:hypothetical protein
MFKTQRAALWTIAAALAAAQTALGDVIIENFTGPDLDEDLWSVFDPPGDGVTIEQVNDRLEWSSVGNPGRAGIFGEPWSLATDEDFEVAVDYSMTFGNPGATTTGLNIALYSGGTPSGTTVDDRLEITIFRWGSLFWYEWALYANGSLVDNDFRQTDASVNRIEISYNAAADSVLAITLEGASDPIVIGVPNVIGQMGADELQLYLGGFMNGITIAVDGSDAWWDTLRVEGTILEPGDGGGDPPVLDARDDAAWFRRGNDADDRFGHSVAFAGDVNGDGVSDVIVGAPRDDGAFNNAGIATVYSGVNGTRILEVTGAAGGEQMGFAVDGAGDWDGDGRDDVVVAAANANGKRGRVEVYSGMPPNALLWSKQGEAANDRFGYAVAGIGDVNNDGFDDILVGAPFNDQGGVDAGRGYVYLGGTGDLWHRKTGRAAGDQFGRAVAAAGDVDDDGDPDYMIAAPLNDQRGTNAGEVAVYSGDRGTRLLVLRRNAGDRLGSALAGAGDVNGDGHADLLVGAPNDDTLGSNAGAALLYSGLDGSVIRQHFGISPGERLGSAVASIADLDGDNVRDIAVAAPRNDVAGSNAGRVLVYSSADGEILVIIDGERNGSELGTALDGDDRPGPFSGLIAGAWKFTSGGLDDRGSAYRFALVPWP